MFLTTSRRSAPSKFRTTLPPPTCVRRCRRQASARNLPFHDDTRALVDARAVLVLAREPRPAAQPPRARARWRDSPGGPSFWSWGRRGAAGVGRRRRARGDEDRRDRHGGAQGRESIFHCHFHGAPQPAGPGLSPDDHLGGRASRPLAARRGSLVHRVPAGIRARAGAAAPWGRRAPAAFCVRSRRRLWRRGAARRGSARPPARRRGSRRAPRQSEERPEPAAPRRPAARRAARSGADWSRP